MQRTIESPGVEINEVDLSLRTVTPVGTKILVHGYTSQGPSNELIQVSSEDELDQVFFGGGGPTNAAEQYFYGSCKEILNSPATLYVTRFPYGTGDGVGYDGEYTALAYPAYTNSLVLHTSEHLMTSSWTGQGSGPINEIFNTSADYGNIVPNSVLLTITRYASSPSTGESIYQYYNTVSCYEYSYGVLRAYNSNNTIGTIDYTTGNIYLSSYVVTSVPLLQYSVLNATYTSMSPIITLYGDTTAIKLGEPVVVPLTESDYMDLKAGLTWNIQPGGNITNVATLSNAGLIIVNEAKTTIDEKYQGYYVSLVGNNVLNLSGNTSITEINTLDSSGDLITLPSTLLGFELTGTNDSGTNMSHSVEQTNFDFSNSYYDDTFVLNLFKLRTSPLANDPDKLQYLTVERYTGSLEAGDIRTNDTTKQSDTFYLANKVNDNSKYIKMYVNQNIAKKATLTSVSNESSTLNPIGSYTPCKSVGRNLKYIGNVPQKISRALGLVENVLDIDIDITIGGGLETIWTYVNNVSTGGNATFDDTLNVKAKLATLCDPETVTGFASDHKTIFDLYNNFCTNTRKDCIHYSDPLRCVFVQGENTKTLEDKTKNFTSNILVPLKNLYSAANSNYSATYANWVNVYDSNNSKYVWMPFSGWQAAITARMDARLQPWYAPFGLNNGLIPNIVDIALKTNQKQQDALYRIGINPVVYFQGDGYVVWGQKTLQAKPSAFDRLNVRRLFLVLERSTMKVMRYFVGEPNTVFTRTRVGNVLKPLFDLAKNNEGCYDYIIVCDERNNKPTGIDNNEMKVDIYIKPVRTAEFILVTFFATRTDQNFSELVG